MKKKQNNRTSKVRHASLRALPEPSGSAFPSDWPVHKIILKEGQKLSPLEITDPAEREKWKRIHASDPILSQFPLDLDNESLPEHLRDFVEFVPRQEVSSHRQVSQPQTADRSHISNQTSKSGRRQSKSHDTKEGLKP
mgnify:CR=1 FL=1